MILSERFIVYYKIHFKQNQVIAHILNFKKAIKHKFENFISGYINQVESFMATVMLRFVLCLTLVVNIGVCQLCSLELSVILRCFSDQPVALWCFSPAPFYWSKCLSSSAWRDPIRLGLPYLCACLSPLHSLSVTLLWRTWWKWLFNHAERSTNQRARAEWFKGLFRAQLEEEEKGERQAQRATCWGLTAECAGHLSSTYLWSHLTNNCLDRLMYGQWDEWIEGREAKSCTC